MEITITHGNRDIVQKLDDRGIPFRYNRCHIYGNLLNECSLSYNGGYTYDSMAKRYPTSYQLKVTQQKFLNLK